MEKGVILSSVSSAERESSPETSQEKDFMADDIADDIFTADDKVSTETSQERDFMADDIADDIFMADDNTKNIVSNRMVEQERVSRLADDTDDKNFQSTCANRPHRFKIGDLARYGGKSARFPSAIRSKPGSSK
jgi:hypothetical protein